MLRLSGARPGTKDDRKKRLEALEAAREAAMDTIDLYKHLNDRVKRQAELIEDLYATAKVLGIKGNEIPILKAPIEDKLPYIELAKKSSGITEKTPNDIWIHSDGYLRYWIESGNRAEEDDQRTEEEHESIRGKATSESEIEINKASLKLSLASRLAQYANESARLKSKRADLITGFNEAQINKIVGTKICEPSSRIEKRLSAASPISSMVAPSKAHEHTAGMAIIFGFSAALNGSADSSSQAAAGGGGGGVRTEDDELDLLSSSSCGR